MTSLSLLCPLPLLPPLLPLSPLDQSEHWIACPALSIERSCRIKAVSLGGLDYGGGGGSSRF